MSSSIIKASKPILMDEQSGKIRNWEKEMIQLLKDFCIPEAKQNEILESTKAESKPNEAQEVTYNRAWTKFWGWYADK